MTEMNVKDFEFIEKLVAMKRENTQEYKAYMKDMKDVMRDMVKMLISVTRDIDG